MAERKAIVLVDGELSELPSGDTLTNSGTSSTPTYQYSAFNSGLTTVSPVFGGGFILRNSAYTGPACRVADSTNSDEVDVPFDAYGRVAGTRPYGSNTRLIKIYDQWGSEDFEAAKSAGIQIEREDDIEFKTWQANFFNAIAGMMTPNAASTNPSWKLEDPLWMIGHKRFNNSGLQTVFAVNAVSNFMAIGLWVEDNDLHFRVDGGGPTDWVNTDWTINSAAAQTFAVALTDMTQQDGNAYAYYNGAADVVRTYANPINTYNNTSRFYLGGSNVFGNVFDGSVTELHLFDRVSAASTTDIAYINTAGEEARSVEPVATSGGGSGIADAPSDGAPYVRQDAAWALLSSKAATMVSALDTQLGQSGWQNPAPVASVTARYWSVREMGTGRYTAKEVKFLGADGTQIPGIYSASSTRFQNNASKANDNNDATYWEAGTGAPNVWFASDFGVGNEVTVTSIDWKPQTFGPNTDAELHKSDDGITWELVGTINHGHTWVAGVSHVMDVSALTLGEFDSPTAVARLDEHFGSTNWRTGGVDYIDVDIPSMTGADDGKGLMWDDATKTFILSTSINGTMLLGGGQELIVEHSLSGNTGLTIDIATHNLDQYDEVMIVFRDADGRMDIELSTDGGTTTQSIVKNQRSDSDNTLTHTQAEFGPDANNLSGSMGVARVSNFLGGAPTTVEAHGGATGGGNALYTYAVADDISLTNAIILTREDANNFTAGTVWVVGIKKSIQPVEILQRTDQPSLAASTILLEQPVIGVRYRAGVIGQIRTNVGVAGTTTVDILNGSSTVIATATIASGALSGDIIAAAPVIVTDEVKARWNSAPGAVTIVDVLLRGELA